MIPLPRSRFSTSKRNPYLAQTFSAMGSSIDWFTLANLPSSIRSAMILKGFCLSCSANSLTTIGGLIEMTCASAGRLILAAGSGLPTPFAETGSLVPGTGGPAGGDVPRTVRMSPRLPNSGRLISGRLGNLAPGFSGSFAPGLGGKLMKPTLSPSLGPNGTGGGGGGAGAGDIGVCAGGFGAAVSWTGDAGSGALGVGSGARASTIGASGADGETGGASASTCAGKPTVTFGVSEAFTFSAVSVGVGAIAGGPLLLAFAGASG